MSPRVHHEDITISLSWSWTISLLLLAVGEKSLQKRFTGDRIPPPPLNSVIGASDRWPRSSDPVSPLIWSLIHSWILKTSALRSWLHICEYGGRGFFIEVKDYLASFLFSGKKVLAGMLKTCGSWSYNPLSRQKEESGTSYVTSCATCLAPWVHHLADNSCRCESFKALWLRESMSHLLAVCSVDQRAISKDTTAKKSEPKNVKVGLLEIVVEYFQQESPCLFFALAQLQFW